MNNLNEKTIEILKEKADYYKKLSKICEESLKSNNITAACKKKKNFQSESLEIEY